MRITNFTIGFTECSTSEKEKLHSLFESKPLDFSNITHALKSDIRPALIAINGDDDILSVRYNIRTASYEYRSAHIAVLCKSKSVADNYVTLCTDNIHLVLMPHPVCRTCRTGGDTCTKIKQFIAGYSRLTSIEKEASLALKKNISLKQAAGKRNVQPQAIYNAQRRAMKKCGIGNICEFIFYLNTVESGSC